MRKHSLHADIEQWNLFLKNLFIKRIILSNKTLRDNKRLNYGFEENCLGGPGLCLSFAFLSFLNIDFIVFLNFNVKNLMSYIYHLHLQLGSVLFPSKGSILLSTYPSARNWGSSREFLLNNTSNVGVCSQGVTTRDKEHSWLSQDKVLSTGPQRQQWPTHALPSYNQSCMAQGYT